LTTNSKTNKEIWPPKKKNSLTSGDWKPSKWLHFQFFQFSISISGEISPIIIIIIKSLKIHFNGPELDQTSIGRELDPRTGPVLLSGSELDKTFCKWGGYPVDVSYSPLSKPGRWTTVRIVSTGSFLEKRGKQLQSKDRKQWTAAAYIP
jgi:hypothetical protein